VVGQDRNHRRPLGAPTGALAGSRPVGLLIAAIASIALGVQLFALLHPGYLRGVTEYDDAVYIGAATRMVHGALPYRDFALVTPPGVPLLMIPVALIGRITGVRDALQIARLVTVLVTAANVVLLGTLLRHRKLATIAVACGSLAAYPSTVVTGHTLMLEPYLVLFCLVGALAVFDGDQIAGSRGLMIGGLAFGFAATIKIWAILPLIAVILVCLPLLRRRLVPLVVGSVAGLVLPCVPFLIAAPSAFVRDVVLVQLERTEPHRVPMTVRLGWLTGISGTTLHFTSDEIYGIAILIVIGVAVVFVSAGPALTPLELFATSSVAMVTASLLWPGAFYYHYAAFLGPFLALLLGLTAARMASAARRLTPAVVVAALAAVAIANWDGATLAARETHAPADDPAATIDAVVPVGACVLTDTTALLVNANRFDLPSRSCPDVVDPLAVTFILNHGRRPGATLADTSPTVRTWLAYLSHADFLILSDSPAIRLPWTPTVVAYLTSHFVRLHVAGLQIFQAKERQV